MTQILDNQLPETSEYDTFSSTILNIPMIIPLNCPAVAVRGLNPTRERILIVNKKQFNIRV